MVRTGKTPRNRGTRGESERFGLTGRVVTKGLLSKVVKPTGLNVAFELAIPSSPVVFEEPGAKLRKLLGGQRLDLLFDPLDLVHDP
jgi:hypothetical protein